MKVFFIGCLHFGHKSIAQYRGFQDEFYHDEHLIEQWNNVVTSSKDIVYILGDITMEKSNNYYQLDRLNGIKHVVLGNHDRRQDVPELLKYVTTVGGAVDYKGFLLTHVPIHPNEVVFYKGNIHCVDSETEILTKNGWKKYNEINIGETIYSLNEKGFLEDDIIENIIINPNYNGNLIEIKDKSTHLIYTDEHRIPYKNKFHTPLRWGKVKDIINRKNIVFLTSGIYLNQNGINLKDDLLRLLICLAADGNITKYKLCRLNVNKKRKFIYFKSILDNLNISYNIHENKSAKYCISFRLPEELEEYNIKGLDNKLLNCNNYQCKLILESYQHTDGYKNSNSVMIYTSKKSEVDILSHLFTINGFRCVTSDRLGGFVNSGINYCISILEKQQVIKTNIKDISKVYKDNILVWCITCKNSNFISRRNGETYITGNCHIHHINELQDLIVLDSYKDRNAIETYTKHKYFNVDAKLLEYKPKTLEEVINLNKI